MAFRIEWKKSTRKDLRKLLPALRSGLSGRLKIWRKIRFLTAWKNRAGRNTPIASGWAITGLFMKLWRNPSWLKSSACGIARMFIGFEMF